MNERGGRGAEGCSVTKKLIKWISPLVAMATVVVDEWFSVQSGSCEE